MNYSKMNKNERICYAAGKYWGASWVFSMLILVQSINVLTDSPLKFLALVGVLLWAVVYPHSGKIHEVCTRCAEIWEDRER